jgi:hypothetical protein
MNDFEQLKQLWAHFAQFSENDPPPGSYKVARGITGWQPGDEPAEVTIRRQRGDDVTVVGCEQCHVNPVVPGFFVCERCLKAEITRLQIELKEAEDELYKPDYSHIGDAYMDMLVADLEKQLDAANSKLTQVMKTLGDTEAENAQLKAERATALETLAFYREVLE